MEILPSLDDYRIYLILERQLAKATVIAYTRDLKLLSQFLGEKPVDNITRDDLRAYMRHLASDGAARATIRRKMQGFSTYFKWLEMEHIVKEPATDGLIIPARKRRVPKFLSTEQLRVFLNTPTPSYHFMNVDRDRTAFRLLAFTGIRRGEMLNLRTEDVKLSDMMVIIREPKGGNDRAVPIADNTLINYLHHVIGEREQDWLFLSAFGNQWDHQSFNRVFQKHVRNCGLTGTTPHVLRHTFATMLAAAGVTIAEIRDLLGHKDIRTTTQYLHSSPQTLRHAVSKHPLADS
jgi:site-specific recombinase XerD